MTTTTQQIEIQTKTGPKQVAEEVRLVAQQLSELPVEWASIKGVEDYKALAPDVRLRVDKVVYGSEVDA